MLRRHYDIVVAANPELVVKVPTANELFILLGWDKLQGQQRIEKWRSIEHLGEDERLEMTPAPVEKTEPEKKAEVEKPTAPVELTDDQADDLIAERLGYTTRQAMRAATRSVKLRSYRDYVRKDAAKPVAPNRSLGTSAGDLDVSSDALSAFHLKPG